MSRALDSTFCPTETWPGYLAPFVITRQGGALAPSGRSLGLGLYGLIPHWAKGVQQGRHTYNARTETADQLSSFKYAWRAGQRCIVPIESFYDPCWESGKAVRWQVRRRDYSPMGVAGLWNAWRAPDGKEVLSFTMLTVNADGHGVMGRMHRPEDEKRMVAILASDEYDQWLHAKPGQMKGCCGVGRLKTFRRSRRLWLDGSHKKRDNRGCFEPDVLARTKLVRAFLGG